MFILRDQHPRLVKAAGRCAFFAVLTAFNASTTVLAGTPMYAPAGLDMTAVDATTRPGNDFFQFQNGAWIARTNIPDDKPFMTAGQELRDRVEGQLRSLVEAAAATAGPEPASVAGKVGAFFNAYMDEARLQTLGRAPIDADLNAIKAMHARAEFATAMGRSVRSFSGSFFSVGISADLRDPHQYAVLLSQQGLSMPDRDYYLSATFAKEKLAFGVYAQRLLELDGWATQDARAQAAAIVALETRIAAASWTRAQQRDLVKTYNAMSPQELALLAPGFPWSDFLKGAGLESKVRVVVGERTAFPKLARIFAATPLATLRAWLAFTLTDQAAPYLSPAFADARFEFRGHTLLGLAQQPPRWKQAIKAVSGGDCIDGSGSCFGTLEWAVGELYTAHSFPPETKRRAEALVASVIAAYRRRIEHLDWMSAATRAEALRKLDTYVVKVGYPDHPRDYSSLIVRGDDLVGNVLRAAAADWSFQVQRSDGPVDASEWLMTPQTVDAYNGPLRDIVFPAAILQPPEFDADADPAVNFGATGSLIGHELTHGFDDQGRALDARGALRDWWAAADLREFEARASALGAQYARYEPVAGLHINPQLTMGENIADLGGVVIALDAYHAFVDQQPKRAPAPDGLTGDQRFFRAYAQSWRGKARDDYIRQLTVSDPHSYRKYRVNGVLPNVDAWYAAFDVMPTDLLYIAPAKRVRIW